MNPDGIRQDSSTRRAKLLILLTILGLITSDQQFRTVTDLSLVAYEV
jgi:hypothetical protein